MQDIDFQQIAPRCGGKREAFEELCCQLARRTLSGDVMFTRLYGAGGDGGVECYADPIEGGRVGWQAKYVWDIDSLITQATASLTTALKIHPTLTRYVVCFPFDLTGPTGRPGRSGQEKFEEWKRKFQDQADSKGRQLIIEAWPASHLRSLLLDFDPSGGIRNFFFNNTVLSPEWFSTHLNAAIVAAGPRYTAELNVETNLGEWLAAFGRTPAWINQLESKIEHCQHSLDQLASEIERTTPDQVFPAWPDELRDDARSLVAGMEVFLNECSRLTSTDDPQAHSSCVGQVDSVLSGLTSLESRLVEDLETQHGEGRADSPGFRQFMAEYMVSFPAANLDRVRDAISDYQDLHDWLQSSEGSLAFERAFVLAGVAGAGKTHGVCDTATHRLNEGLLTCVIFGHVFEGEPDPWTRSLESLGLPLTLGRDGLLDTLNSAAEASGFPLVICIDAINETRPLRYWRDRLASFAHVVQSRPYLRLCVTCRTSFLPYCLPEGHGLPIVEHRGFEGLEHVASKEFFQNYGLKPPIAPILQPELSNPLYLRLVCETLNARGLDRLPTGWHGLSQVIRAFLEEKERQFSHEYGTSLGANIVCNSLRSVVRAIAESGESSLSWSRAQQVVAEASPEASGLMVVDWLVRADLLIDDAAITDNPFGDEAVVRPAFERLGDFLIAIELLDGVPPTDIDSAFRPGGSIHPFLKSTEVSGQNSGVISALSIILPERIPGVELPYLVEDDSVRPVLLEITVRSFPWRDVASFSSASQAIMCEALAKKGLGWDAMDVVLSVSWRQSTIDALWLHGFLKRIPLAERDSRWCGYLHERYEARGPVKRLIEAAFELPLDEVEAEVAERWAVMLMWFAAAADRRVKDQATRAAVALLVARPEVIPAVLTSMLDTDDDELRERALLTSYGALIVSQDGKIVRDVTNGVHEAYRKDPTAFDNALIRDHIRCITELAQTLDVMPDSCELDLTMRPVGSEWPLILPSDEDVQRWDNLPMLVQSCLHDDFYIYSMGCLRPWDHAMPKERMGQWILKSVADRFGYEGSGCERYDRYMLGKYGGGRGKPTWAERIGKKYQWVALYQLASRLHDHVERRQDNWTPEPQRTPLILLEERKLDPTLPRISGERHREAQAWWVGSSADLQSGEHLSDADWIGRHEDIPSLESLLAIQERDGQRWQLLCAYPSWGEPKEGARRNEPYRNVWIHIQSYLVPKDDIDSAYELLHRRNFFGAWMPEGATWLYGFAGEYPWGTSFNTEPEEWYGRGGSRGDLPASYSPTFNQLAVSWEYDASLPGSFHMLIPARPFFIPRDLWWNGRDSYRLNGGKTVFRDPSVTEAGPSALVADVEDLLERLNKLGLRLIWTTLGEKWILGGVDSKPRPQRTFSQIARMEEDGSLHIGERVFFDDYEKDTGPLQG